MICYVMLKSIAFFFWVHSLDSSGIHKLLNDKTAVVSQRWVSLSPESSELGVLHPTKSTPKNRFTVTLFVSPASSFSNNFRALVQKKGPSILENKLI